MVLKIKDGKQVFNKDGEPVYRVIANYRHLNGITILNSYPLTLLATIKENISQAQWFIALDLIDSYYIIRIAKGEEWKIAI